MIALPFVAPKEDKFPFNYRLLVNQYNEELEFTIVDKAVPNRGVRVIPNGPPPANTDQFLVTLDYEQQIEQIASDDFPKSGKAGDPGLAIHHEPGLWLHMTNGVTDSLNIARLVAIPHGDSLLALGRSSEHPGVGGEGARGLGDIGVAEQAQQRDGEVTQCGHHARTVAGAHLGAGLIEGDIAHVVAAVIDRPVGADTAEQLSGVAWSGVWLVSP